MRVTLTFSPDPSVGMVPMADIIRDRFEPCGVRVIQLDAYQATVAGELDEIVDALRSLDGFLLRRTGIHAVIHLHFAMSELDCADPDLALAYDAVCEGFLNPDATPAGDHGLAL
jgi:hypothetical protein